MKILRILTALGFAAVLASPLAAAPRKAHIYAPEAAYANPSFLGARAQAPGLAAPYATGDNYIGTDPDPNIRSELQRDPPAARQ